MDIYILRHGEAEPRGEDVRESRRELTARGRRDVERVMRLAKALKVKPEAVLSSPYDRAVQTAAIAVDALKSKAAVTQTKALLPGSNPVVIWKEILSSYKDMACLLLAGHEPHTSRLLAYLLAAPELNLDFKKGSLVHISIDVDMAKPSGRLKWILTPAVARATSRKKRF